MAKPREYFKFNFSKVVKFDCTCGRRYINTDKCLQETDSRMPQTRADVIRSMNDEELADMLHNIGSYVENGEPLIDIYIGENKSTIDDSFGFILEWLQSEAE